MCRTNCSPPQGSPTSLFSWFSSKLEFMESKDRPLRAPSIRLDNMVLEERLRGVQLGILDL